MMTIIKRYDVPVAVGDRLTATGYPIPPTDASGKKQQWPPFLAQGTHTVQRVKKSPFGTLIRTDRDPQMWVNAIMFTPQ